MGLNCRVWAYRCRCRADDDEGQPVQPGHFKEVSQVEGLVFEPSAIRSDRKYSSCRLRETIALTLIFAPVSR